MTRCLLASVIDDAIIAWLLIPAWMALLSLPIITLALGLHLYPISLFIVAGLISR